MRFFGRATHFLRMTGMFNSADGADVKAKKKDIYAL